jgi:hypothetical protein
LHISPNVRLNYKPRKMKPQVIIALIVVLLFSKCKSWELSVTTPPNEDLINEVIYSVILQDSLIMDYGIDKYIDVPDIYSLKEWDGNPQNPPPPPPPSAFGYSFKELFKCFNSENDPKMRLMDSLFIIQQVDTTLNYKISKNVSKLFNHSIYESYFFSRPIFSNDKNTAIVIYHLNYYHGNQTILKNIDNKWHVVSHKITWMR